MENGLSTIQKYFRIQRIAVIFFLLMMVVSLLLPYTKVEIPSFKIPGGNEVLIANGYRHTTALIIGGVVFIYALLIVLKRTITIAIIAFFVAILSGILLLILLQEIHLGHFFNKQSLTNYTYQLGFYLIFIGGICIIITAFVNLLLVSKNAQKEQYVNSELIDDLE